MLMEELRQRLEEKIASGEIKTTGGNRNIRAGNFATRPNTAVAASMNARPKIENSRPDIVALTNAARLWAQVSTNADLDRAPDIERDKLRAVREFFAFLDKDLFDVTPLDVQEWQTWLKDEHRMKATSVYNSCAHLSSFFEWIKRQPELGRFLPFNPVRAAFPKCPSPYQSQATRALDDKSLENLWTVMTNAGRGKSTVGRRDYAMFLFFAATGDRRAEIANLRGNDIVLSESGLIYYPRAKGGNRTGKAINDADVVKALLDYVRGSGRRRRDVFGRDVPVWLAHDHAENSRQVKKQKAALGKTLPPSGKIKLTAPKGLTSHAFARRMKSYALQAGIYGFHLHQLRHTFARVVSEETGSISAAQEALGHKNQRTTSIYVRSIGIRADAHSSRLKERILKSGRNLI